MKQFMKFVIDRSSGIIIKCFVQDLYQTVCLRIGKGDEIAGTGSRRIFRVPELIGIAVQRGTPARHYGVKITPLHPLDHHTPFQCKDFQLNPGCGKIFFQNRRHAGVGGIYAREDQCELKGLSVLIQNAVTIGITPACFFQQRFCLYRIERIGFDVFIVRSRAAEKCAGNRCRKILINVFQQPFPIDQMGERYTDTTIRKQRILLI